MDVSYRLPSMNPLSKFPATSDWDHLEADLQRSRNDRAALLTAGRFYARWHAVERAQQAIRFQKERKDDVAFESDEQKSYLRKVRRSIAEEVSTFHLEKLFGAEEG